ncbi:epoxide hydrolase 4 isoform X2 [Nematostella vectensis]|uniref:epoxide hydrolase 4 isoform X2 n=1 Tax=Nematostella vectensis TaxID=45351 RepID=UPI0020774573|nr:epoxide hydrolase 4 isoform X2 [Nematostella vectensis]
MSIFESFSVISFILVHILALFFGCLVLLRIAWTIIRNPSALKAVKITAPTSLTNPEFGEHCYMRTPSGLNFHYVAKGDLNKPLMLCLHGFPEFWYSWRYQLQWLSENYRVVAMDMRGYGESDHPKGRGEYVMTKLTQDVREVMSGLGFSSCILACHDWGGFIGWTFAHQFPDMVERLIIVNCPHPMAAEKYVFTHPSQLLRSWYVYFFQLPYLPEFWIALNNYEVFEDMFRGEQMGVRKPGSLTDEDLAAYRYMFSREGALTPPLNYYRNVLVRTKSDRDLFKGTGDRALESGMLEGTADFAPNLTIRYVDGASHWVQQEEPEVVNECIHDFLTAQSYEMINRPN